MQAFDLNNYLGRWYQLIQYASWFTPSDSYNVTTFYEWDNEEQKVKIENRCIFGNGERLTVNGYAAVIALPSNVSSDFAGRLLQVDFSPESIQATVATLARHAKTHVSEQSDMALQQRQQQQSGGPNSENRRGNYVIQQLWTDDVTGNYIAAVVTNPTKTALFALFRSPRPALILYQTVMRYCYDKFDEKRIQQTPFYEENVVSNY